MVLDEIFMLFLSIILCWIIAIVLIIMNVFTFDYISYLATHSLDTVLHFSTKLYESYRGEFYLVSGKDANFNSAR